MNSFDIKYWGPTKIKAYKQFLRHKLRVVLKKGGAPDFIIAGVQKAGTTSLFRYLIQHKDINQPLKKEVHYFDRCFNNSKAWYYSFFVKKDKKNLIGEATPNYFFWPSVPSQLNKLLPDVRVIVLVRNPVERAISHYKMMLRRGLEKETDILKALKRDIKIIDADFKKLEKDENYKSKALLKFGYVNRGMYDQIYKEWLNYVSSENILFLGSEELFSSPQLSVDKACEFLGVEKFTPPEMKNFNPSKNKAKKSEEAIDFLVNHFTPHVKKFEELTNKKFNWKYFD